MDVKLAAGMARSVFRKSAAESDLFCGFVQGAEPLRRRFMHGRKAMPEHVRAAGAAFARVLGSVDGAYMPRSYAGERRKAAALHVSSHRAIVLCASKVGIAATSPGFSEDECFELIAIQGRYDRRRACIMRRHTLVQLAKHTLERFLARESGTATDFLAAMRSGLVLAPALFRAVELREGAPMALPFADGLLLGELSPVTAGIQGEAQIGLTLDRNGVSQVRFEQPAATFAANMRTFVSHEMMSSWQERLRDRLLGILEAHAAVLEAYADASCFEEFDPPVGTTDAAIFARAQRNAAPAIAALAEFVASPLWIRTVRQRPTTAPHRFAQPLPSEVPAPEAMAPAA